MRRRNFLIGAAATAAIAALPLAAQAASPLSNTPISNFPTTDGHVYASTAIGNSYFAGGRFSHAGGKAVGNLIRIDYPSWKVTSYSSPVVLATAATGTKLLTGGAGYITSRDIRSGVTKTIGLGEVVNGMAGNAGRVAIATNLRLILMSADLKHTYWSHPVTGGPAMTVYWQDSKHLIVGGIFDSYNGNGRHGVAKVYVPTGNTFKNFNPGLKHNSYIGEKGSWDGQNVGSVTHTDSGNLVFGLIGRTTSKSNGLLWVNPVTGARLGYRTSVGDVQALARVGSRIVSGCHTNESWLTASYGGYRMATSWHSPGQAAHYTDWNPGFSQNSIVNGVPVGNPDGQNDGVQTFRLWKGMLVVGGEFTGTGDYTRTIYGTFPGGKDLHPRRSLAAFKVA